MPNFDYAMAPGVLKTFKKELKKCLKFGYEDMVGETAVTIYDTIDAVVDSLTTISLDSIEISDAISEKEELPVNDDSWQNMVARAYDRAFKATDKATYQAMEGLVHNLNTMHCLPGSERIWVKEGEEVKLITMEDLDKNFKTGRFKALSINPKTGKASWKNITASKRQDNNRELAEIVTTSGQKVTVTTNHKVATMKGTDISFDYPENINNILSLRGYCANTKNKSIDISSFGMVRRDTPVDSDQVVITEAMAELLGIYAGDGSIVAGSQMELSVNTKIEEKKLSHLVNAAFGKTITYKVLRRGVNGNAIVYRFNLGNRVCRFIKSYMGESANAKCVPNEILQGSSEVKKAFLKGYFATDGRHTTKYQNVSSVSRDLIKGVNFVIHSLGELAYMTAEKLNRYNNPSYQLSFGNAVAGRLSVDTAGTAKHEYLRYNTSMLYSSLMNKEDVKVRKTGSVPIAELERYSKLHPEEADTVEKFLNVFCIDVKEIVLSNSGNEYVYDISVEDYENFMTEDCLFVHNSRAGAQVPFSSLNFGTDTSPEGRMVIKNLLLATDAGLGNGETAIFPVSIFKVKEGVNFNEGDPNYDLFKLAIRVSAKRLFPNFSFLDAPFNIPFYKEGDYNTEVAYMG